MGYTHYWYRTQVLDKEKFKGFSEDCKKIVEACRKLGVKIVDGAGNQGTEPFIDKDEVLFNGQGEASHETFCIERVYEPESWQKPEENGLWFSFCKTAMKPYDIAVTACLTSFIHWFPDAEVSSDGGDEDWQAGRELYESVCRPIEETEKKEL